MISWQEQLESKKATILSSLMVTCTYAAALSSPDRITFLAILCFLLTYLAQAQKYSCAELIGLDRGLFLIPEEFSILPKNVRTTERVSTPAEKLIRWRSEQKHKRGKRASVWTRLKTNPLKPPLPSIFLCIIVTTIIKNLWTFDPSLFLLF